MVMVEKKQATEVNHDKQKQVHDEQEQIRTKLRQIK